jgi:hypothetical protein
MLTPAASWLAAANAGAAPCFLLSITDGVTTWKCTSSATTYFASDVAVVSVSSVGTEIDPLTREMQTSECVVDVLDAWIRPILVNNRLKGKRATITYGFQGIPEADFLSYAAGPIGEISFEGQKDSGIVSLSVVDLMSTFRDQMVTASWINKHPLHILYDGSTGSPMTGTDGGHSLLSMCGYDSATWVDESTFAPTDAAYTSSISHWCVSRISPFDVCQPTSAADLINDLCRIMTGSIVADEAGVLAFKRWVASATAVDSFTVDDILPGTFRQEPLDANVVNRVVIRLAGHEGTAAGAYGVSGEGSYPERTIVLNDTDSQTAYAYPGQSARVLSSEFATSFCPPGNVEPLATIEIGATTFAVQGELHEYSGMRGYVWDHYPLDVVVQAAGATLSADRVAWLLLDNELSIGAETEIVKATAGSCSRADRAGVTPENLNQCTAEVFDFQANTWSNRVYAKDFLYSTVVRAQLGTAELRHPLRADNAHTMVRDVTALVDAGTKTLERFKYGCPIVEFATPAHKMALQQGDTVTLVYPDFIAYALDGVTTATTWEIVGKECDLMASPPQIKWLLAMNTTTATVFGSGRFTGPRIQAEQLRESFIAEESDQGIVSQGFTVTATAGLEATISAGSAVAGGRRNGRPRTVTLSFLASRDSYILYDPFNNHFRVSDVANLAAAPAKMGSEIWIARVRTNATDITLITDLRETLPYNFDKVKDGATWLKVGSVDASNKITSGSVANGAIVAAGIGAQAVGAAAVADGAIAGVHVATGDARVYANHNANFQQWTRG